MALAHKGLDVEDLPWRFTEKDRIAATGQPRVPVLVHGTRWIADSWAIADYLEESFPDRPSLFGSPEGRALARFVNEWGVSALHPKIIRVILPDIFAALHDKDRDYFRTTREQRFGMPLEQIGGDRDALLAALARELVPLETLLGQQNFVSGAAPLYADYAVFGTFQWARVVGGPPLVAADSAICAWLERMLDLQDGLARRTRCAGQSAKR